MASPQFDSNTWYSVRNLGNNFFLGCNSISICGADTNDLTNFELFQITTVGSSPPYYIRPKARDVDENGQPFCINIVSGQPFLELCTNVSAIWGTGYWNSANTDDGLFFYNTQLGESQRLFLTDNGTWSFPDYTSEPTSEQDLMQWSVTSRAAINDESYSTVPAVITNSGAAVVAVSSTDSSSMMILTSSNTTSMSSSPSTSSVPASTTSTNESRSTTIVVETPTVTDTTSSSSPQTSTSSSTTPTVMSSAGCIHSNTRTIAAFAMMFVVPQLILWLS